MVKLNEANKIMGIVNESLQKIIELKDKVDTKRMYDGKAHLIYEGIEFCFLELIEMQDKLERELLELNSEEVKTCATKHVIPPKSKDSGILPNFT